jgi:hypothetical protein
VGQFFLGLTIAALNPTLILTWSVSAAMLYSLANLTLQGSEWIAFATSVVFGIVAWFTILLALLRRFRGHFPLEVLQRVIRGHFPLEVLQRVIRGLGAVLVITAVVMAAFALFG